MHKTLLGTAALLLLAAPALAQTTGTAAETAAPAYDSFEASGADANAEVMGGMTAKAMMDADVIDASGGEVAEVEDLLVGPDGKVEAVAIEVGGFLGLGDHKVAVPLDRFSVADGALTTDMTEGELKDLPEIEEEDGKWVAEE